MERRKKRRRSSILPRLHKKRKVRKRQLGHSSCPRNFWRCARKNLLRKRRLR